MSISNYAELAILNAAFNNTSFVVAQPYVKLHIGDPGEAGTSNAATETTRKALSCGAAASGAVTSDADLIWTSVAGSETISHLSIWDASTAGNCLWTGALSASKNVNLGDTFTIPAGSLSAALD